MVVPQDLSPLFVFPSVPQGNLYCALPIPVFNLLLQPIVTHLFQTTSVAGFVVFIVASGISVMVGK